MNAMVHSSAPAAPVIVLHCSADRELVASESPPHCRSMSGTLLASFLESDVLGTYHAVGDTKSDSANDGEANGHELENRVAKQRASVRVIPRKRPLKVKVSLTVSPCKLFAQCWMIGLELDLRSRQIGIWQTGPHRQ